MNDAQLLQKIEVEDRAKEVKEIAPQMSSKALGNKWDVTDDVLFIYLFNYLFMYLFTYVYVCM